jgi:hypothetical protein
MDIFSTVVAAARVAKEICDLVKGTAGAPQTLEYLQVELQELEIVLKRLERCPFTAGEQGESLRPILEYFVNTLNDLRKLIEPYRTMLTDNKLKRTWRSLMTHMKEDDIQKFLDWIQ